MKWVKIIETDYGTEDIVNLENVSAIAPYCNTIILNGVHGEKDGVYHIDEESMQKILSLIEVE